MAEIKISELSVGDWVKIKGTDKIVKIAQINGDLDEIRVFGYKHFYCFYDLDYIEPIPLTPEILEKNGFVKKNYDNGKMWDWWCDNVLVRKFADEDIYRFIVAFNSKHYTTMMVVGKHTHQLQHALRLAGVKKEIEV